MSTFNRLYMALGEQEGVGGLCTSHRSARTEAEVTEEEIDAFLQRSDAFFDGVFHTVNQFAIVAALTFTISVPLAVYNLDGIETFGTRDAALGGDGNPGVVPGLARAAGAARLPLGILPPDLPVGVLQLGGYFAGVLCSYPTYSLYMPDMEARLDSLCLPTIKSCGSGPTRGGAAVSCCWRCRSSAPASSPVVSMCTAIPAVGAIRMIKSTCWKWGASGDFPGTSSRSAVAAGADHRRARVRAGERPLASVL